MGYSVNTQEASRTPLEIRLMRLKAKTVRTIEGAIK